MFSIGQKAISYIDKYFLKYSSQNMSFWAKLPCPTNILITGNVKFYQKIQCTDNIFTSSVPSYIILSHNKEYFFVHALVFQKSGHL